MRLIDSIDAIIFDLDGTLLDTAEGIVKSIEYTVSYLGYPKISMQKMHSFIGPPIRDSLKKEFSLGDADADFATNIFRERYKSEDLLRATAYPELFELLAFIQVNGRKMGIATYKREDYAIKISEHFGLSEYCTSIKGADFGNELTKQDILSCCIKELGVASDRVLYIGDSESDARAALNLNTKFLGVSFGYGFKEGIEYGNLQIVPSLKDVLKELS